MKFGLFGGFNECLERYGAIGALRKVKEWGYSYAEALYSKKLFTKEVLHSLKDALEAEEMKFPCYSACIDMTLDSSLDTAKEVVDHAAFLGAKFVHHTLVPSLVKPVDKKTVFDLVVERVRVSADHAARKGLTLLVEPQGLVFNGLENLREFFAAVEGENVFYCSDIGNGVFVDADVLALAREFLPITKHVHVKDYRFGSSPSSSLPVYQSISGRRFYDVIPGEGDLPLAEFLALFQGLDVNISLEYFAPEEELPQTLQNVKALL